MYINGGIMDKYEAIIWILVGWGILAFMWILFKF